MMPDKVVFRESPLLWKMQDKNFPYLSCLRRVTLFINFKGNRPLEISNNPHSLNLSCKMGFIWMRTNLFSWQKLRSLPRIEKEAGSEWIGTLTGCDKINANNVTNFVVKWASDKVIQNNIPDFLLDRDNQTRQQNRLLDHQEYPNIFFLVWVHRTLHLASQEFCKEIKIPVIKLSSTQINHLRIFGGELELACSRGMHEPRPRGRPRPLPKYEFSELRCDVRLDNIKRQCHFPFLWHILMTFFVIFKHE